VRQLARLFLEGVTGVAIGACAIVVVSLTVRYEYRTVPSPLGGYVVLQHDRWTERQCLAYVKSSDPPWKEFNACEFDLTQFVRLPPLYRPEIGLP
jgi:hypothetical protein